MSFEEYIVQDGKKMRLGYTTGTCAVATTLAACQALEEGQEIFRVALSTPAGIDLDLEVFQVARTQEEATYGIYKDGGDDPDVTHGAKITSRVRRRGDGKIVLDGGRGVGRFTQKALFGQPGQAAINPVPRQLLMEVLEDYDQGGLDCLIEVEGGEDLAKRTFNPYLGIEGGVSILGTKGIVYPMSQAAYVKTFSLEMDLLRDQGQEDLLLVFGNYGGDLAPSYGLNLRPIKVSNYLGEALRYGEAIGFKRIHVIGHIGKLAKTSIGIFNTHSAVSDTRMEAFVYYLYHLEAPRDLIQKVEAALTAQEALKLCREAGYGHISQAMEAGCQKRISQYIRNDKVDIQVHIYTMD
ncbi:MAG: cobalt-precorrin-5B (C(1))-methyltransferase CbiD [Tissierellia bacterium]|nr:cobalt-precorrin-5B (C(1))-methyltransferase CbiD [Tissierellia bacterium]